MTLNIEQITRDTINKIESRIKNLAKLNIIVAGKTGVGKSTLINSVFREKIAETGMGKPVTEHMRKIEKKDVPLAIYDTRGFELGKEAQTEVKQEVFDTISGGLVTRNINEAIHCIWYCINTASNRVEPEEIKWLKELSEDNQIMQVPIIIVLTQSFSKKKATEMRNMILKENLNVIQVIPVLSNDYEIEELGIAKSYGLDVLIKVMGDSLPEELIDTLQNVQIVSLEEKKRHAHKAVIIASVAAASEGAVPIPFSDWGLLIPTQISMICSITIFFGFSIEKSVITALISSTIGTGGATFVGKKVFSNILKCIPGIGTAAGSAVSAATAGITTMALGEAYIGIMELVFKGDMSINDIGTKKGKETINTLYKENFKLSQNL